MSELALKIENISKQYRLGTVGTGTLSHDLNRWWSRIRGKEDPYLQIGQNKIIDKSISKYVWALQDINFEVKQGEVLGIIGKNGAGKSTLLKLLSKVTGPTTGNIKVNGKIASLLEVGTGFHPELTGKENIFLNGAILGMTRNDIKKSLGEIISFAGVQKYIDTPVKRYSSGMYVRLAFSVAAHLNSDILIVDEVLAVGDAEFQKKCLGKMKDISSGQGRTVLFVSHNMTSIEALCNRAIILESGNLTFGPDMAAECVKKYLSEVNNKKNNLALKQRKDRQTEGRFLFTDFWIENELGEKIDTIRTGEKIEFKIEYLILDNSIDFNDIQIAIAINSLLDQSISDLSNFYTGQKIEINKKGGILSCSIKDFPLNKGQYFINLFAKNGIIIEDWVQKASILTVDGGDFFGTGKALLGDRPFLIKQTWS